MPLLSDAKTCYVGTTPITKIMAGSVQVWPTGSIVSGKPYPINAYVWYEDNGAGTKQYHSYFTYDVPDLMLWDPQDYGPIGEPAIEGNIRFPEYDPAINKIPSGDEVFIARDVWYLGKRFEFGKTVYSYRSRSRVSSGSPPPAVKFNYTITINGVVSDVAEADLHYP